MHHHSATHCNAAHFQDGATPLYIACGMGHLPVVQHLISAKADVNRSLQVGCSNITDL